MANPELIGAVTFTGAAGTQSHAFPTGTEVGDIFVLSLNAGAFYDVIPYCHDSRIIASDGRENTFVAHWVGYGLVTDLSDLSSIHVFAGAHDDSGTLAVYRIAGDIGEVVFSHGGHPNIVTDARPFVPDVPTSIPNTGGIIGIAATVSGGIADVAGDWTPDTSGGHTPAETKTFYCVTGTPTAHFRNIPSNGEITLWVAVALQVTGTPPPPPRSPCFEILDVIDVAAFSPTAHGTTGGFDTWRDGLDSTFYTTTFNLPDDPPELGVSGQLGLFGAADLLDLSVTLRVSATANIGDTGFGISPTILKWNGTSYDTILTIAGDRIDPVNSAFPRTWSLIPDGEIRDLRFAAQPSDLAGLGTTWEAVHSALKDGNCVLRWFIRHGTPAQGIQVKIYESHVEAGFTCVITPPVEPPPPPPTRLPEEGPTQVVEEPEVHASTSSGGAAWASDVRISMPMPPNRNPQASVGGGFAFTSAGLVHDITDDIYKRLTTPTFAPADFGQEIVYDDDDLDGPPTDLKVF